jgi:hypothetical protein
MAASTSHNPMGLHGLLQRQLYLKLFNNANSTKAMWRGMVGWQMNWKGFRRKRSWPNKSNIRASAWQHWGKVWRTSVRIAGDWAGIRTEYPRNTNQERIAVTTCSVRTAVSKVTGWELKTRDSVLSRGNYSLVRRHVLNASVLCDVIAGDVLT